MDAQQRIMAALQNRAEQHEKAAKSRKYAGGRNQLSRQRLRDEAEECRVLQRQVRDSDLSVLGDGLMRILKWALWLYLGDNHRRYTPWQMMSDLRAGEILNGADVCGDQAARHQCLKNPHPASENHHCDPDLCFAEWSYDEAGSLVRVRWPERRP